MRAEDRDGVYGEHHVHVVGDDHRYVWANDRADARTDRHADLRSKAHADSGVHLHLQALVDGNDDVRMDDNNHVRALRSVHRCAHPYVDLLTHQIPSLQSSHETHARASNSDDTAASNIPQAPSANFPLPFTTVLDPNPQAEPAGAVISRAYGPLHGLDDRMLVDSDVEQSGSSNPIMPGYEFGAATRPHTVPSGAISSSRVDIERLTDSAVELSGTAAYPIIYTNPHPNSWNNAPANVDIALQKPQRPTVDANNLDDVFGLPSTSQSLDRNHAEGSDHQASRSAGPSAAEVNPVSEILTPLAASACIGWYSDDDAANGASSDSTSPAVGRISNATLQRVRDAYEDVLQLAKDVRAETGLSTGQVFDQWFTTYAGSGTRSKGNMWNLYNVYFKTHASEELNRISLVCVDSPVEDRKKPSRRELCYAAFKADNGEKAQEILMTFQGIQQVTEAKKQTVAQRTRAFKQYSARVTNLMDSFETHHGFSGAVILVGNSVNSDGHLATVHMTKHAEGFFEDKCRAPSDVLIGHMKSHVYNRVSNTMIGFTWEGEPEAGTPTPAKGKQRASDKHAKAASQHWPNEALRGGASSARPAASSPVKAAQSEDDEDLLIIRKDKPKFICQKFRKLLGQIDVAVNASLFPWKTLTQVLSTNGAWMDNWPEDVPWPGEPVGEQTKSRRPTKGITTLKSAEINALLASLKAPVHRIRFHKCQNDHEKLGAFE
ncbi:hypothetical protein NUW54_g10538 [Trametes sanguinea]|uniref:Uncharacterized protein n=1 Tax=Trametes sanguinea TaxID=158606 RepID=A0ACC1NZX2_9APHY|nr:hypothetical protein NUW54_g10538 [Trametes sanguinea]